ncbi:hypothetical protein NM688_g1932 [Phlebia brevispora]|uniref:Uncharacterized protein n=1 Tax=Phlebia brevispora TaxID=194682 RepID=A0ACC1T9P7_9APHY|nr:hypothetical protein NM688_g1932 [Phlebia brevispora]
MAEQPIFLPIATIQTDFQTSIDDVFNGLVPEDKFWLSCYKTGEQSVHGKVHLTLNERDRNLVDYEGVDGVEFAKEQGDKYTASCASLGISHTHLAAATSSYSDFLPKAHSRSYRTISAFDIAPDSSQFAVGYGDGSVYTVSATRTTPVAISSNKSHLSTVTSLQFFPSSRVLLTAGVDFALSILSAELPSGGSASESGGPTKIAAPVRTFKGHNRAVTSTAIISRGRNVLSGSKDGSVRLWDVSSGDQIRMLGVGKATGVLCMSLGDKGGSAFTQSPDGEGTNAPLSTDPREVETAEKVVFCGLADGSFEVFDLGSKLSVFRSSTSDTTLSTAALNSIAYSSEHSLLATGSGSGVVRVYDTRSLSKPLVSFARNQASIEDVAFLSLDQGSGVGLAIATEDGLPYVADIRPEGPSVRAELIGTDCDAVRRVRIRSDAREIWTAGDDGVVRKYDGSKL